MTQVSPSLSISTDPGVGPSLQVLDLYSPRWECLDEGAYITGMPWAKQRAVYTCFYGNKLFTLKSNMQEKLFELQVWGLTIHTSPTLSSTPHPLISVPQAPSA